ncbi:hypothetical protein DFJ77DRAFT_441096 [Powellomyces hirtus]|nr:hypothetical protein DFJ77DRAFT_441096 [Powellomyces hirtus]
MAKIGGLINKLFRRSHSGRPTNDDLNTHTNARGASTTSLPLRSSLSSSTNTPRGDTTGVRRSVSFQLGRPSSDAVVGVGEREPRGVRTSKSWDDGERVVVVAFSAKRKRRWSEKLVGTFLGTAKHGNGGKEHVGVVTSSELPSRGCFSLDDGVRPETGTKASITLTHRGRSVDAPPLPQQVQRLRRSNSYSNLKRVSGEGTPPAVRKSRSLDRARPAVPLPPTTSVRGPRFSFLRKLRPATPPSFIPAPPPPPLTVRRSNASTPPDASRFFTLEERIPPPNGPPPSPDIVAAAHRGRSVDAGMSYFQQHPHQPRRSNSFTGRQSTDGAAPRLRTSRSWDGNREAPVIPVPRQQQPRTLRSRFSFLRSEKNSAGSVVAHTPPSTAPARRRAYFSLDVDAAAAAYAEAQQYRYATTHNNNTNNYTTHARHPDKSFASHRRRTVQFTPTSLPTVSEVGSSALSSASSATGVTTATEPAVSAYEAYVRRHGGEATLDRGSNGNNATNNSEHSVSVSVSVSVTTRANTMDASSIAPTPEPFLHPPPPHDDRRRTSGGSCTAAHCPRPRPPTIHEVLESYSWSGEEDYAADDSDCGRGYYHGRMGGDSNMNNYNNDDERDDDDDDDGDNATSVLAVASSCGSSDTCTSHTACVSAVPGKTLHSSASEQQQQQPPSPRPVSSGSTATAIAINPRTGRERKQHGQPSGQTPMVPPPRTQWTHLYRDVVDEKVDFDALVERWAGLRRQDEDGEEDQGQKQQQQQQQQQQRHLQQQERQYGRTV